MLPTGQPQYVEIFVTHVMEDGPLLKIFGQLDRSAAIFVEKLILQYSEQFERGVGAIYPGTVPVDSVFCAKYGGDGVYYRAKILDVSNIQQGFVRVNFIDYGNSDIVNISNIRSLNGMQNSPLCSVQSQATEFILAGIVPPMGVAWDDSSVEFIKEKLCYAEFKCVIVAQFSGKKLIKLYYNDVDFAEILVQKNLALRMSLHAQQNMLQNFHQYGSVPPLNYSVPPPMPVPYNNTANANLLVKAAAITKQESGVISAPLLAVGSKHSVYISYVEDGPYLFAVQLKSTENILQNMTKAFTQFMLKPFSQSPIPGSACVTILSTSKVLCRAVVTNILGDECVVYCVDFGNTETVPFSQIFEVPSQFLNTKSLAMRFSLAGIQNANFNEKAKRIFQELVVGETLLLEVVEPEGPPLKQYGNFYLNGDNMVTLLKERMRIFEKPKAYPPLPAIQPGRIVNVTVSFIESVNEFYVQYEANSKALTHIMTTMSSYCTNSAAMIRPDELYVGMPVCALFSADQTWYRARVVSVAVSEITVFHVDYGSTDAVSLMSLRHMDPNLSLCQAQAVLCSLSGFQDCHDSLDDVSNKLEELTLERKLTMKILSHLANGRLLVELHDTTVAPVQNIAEQIKKPVQPTIDEWRDPAASGEPAILPSQSTQFSRDKSKYEDGSGEGWKSDSKKSGGWGEGRDGNKKWGNRDDRGRDDWRGDKKWNRNDQGGEENQWGKEGNEGQDSRENRDDRSKKWGNSENRGDRNWGNKGEREDRRGFNRDGNDWKSRDNRKGFSNEGDDWKEKDKKGFNETGDGFRDRENRRGFNKGGDDWKDRDNNRGGFNREGGDWKDRDGSRQGFRDGDNRRGGGFNREGGDRNWKKNDTGNSEGKKWWGHDDRGEPEKKWNSQNEKQDGDQRWGNRDKRSSSGGDFKKWNDGPNQRNIPNVTKVEVVEEDSWETDDVAANDGLKSAEGKQSKPYPEPELSLGSKYNVTLVSADDPTSFVVQVDEKIPEISKIMEDIAAMYETGGKILPESSQQLTSPCIARYPEDEVWYRAVITKPPSNGSTEVHFVDYGNRMEVPSGDVKEITSELKSSPVYGVPCSLFAVKVPVAEWTQEQIDEFLNVADGKKLEAQVVKKTGPVFEVVLADLEDPSISVNEKFGATKQALEAGLAKKDSTSFERKPLPFSQSQPRTLELEVEYAAPEDTLVIADIDAGVTEEVCVSWFINPDLFYCQRSSCKAEFSSMVNDIQSAYKKRPAFNGTISVGQPVIARFPADKVLYRAEIIEKKGLKYQVQYVDYGNMELLAPANIWQIEKRFLLLPKQAIPCGLQGVLPIELEWPKDSPEFEKYFGVENVQCTFHGIVETKYSVSLNVNGQDVAKELVSSGLANEKEEVKVHPKQPLAYHLLKGQKIAGHVSYIESVAKFFVHLDPATAKSIQEKIEKHMESAKSAAPPTDLVEHQMCLATPDGTDWYRGKIIDIPAADQVSIDFVDFGDSHTVPLDQVRVLPDTLLGYRDQATECRVVGSSASGENKSESVEETFKAEVEGQEVLIVIEDTENKVLVVHLFDIEGHCLELLKTVDTSSPVEVEPFCLMPILTNTEPMWVSHIDGVSSLWLQKECDADILSGLLELLFSFYEEEAKGVEVGEPMKGQLCAAKSNDGSWYRARIKDIADEEITVLYIDYGNTEILSKSEVKELDSSFCSMHSLAVCGSLSVQLEDPERCSTELETLTTETLFDVSFARNEDRWCIHLENDNVNLVSHLVALGVVSEIPVDAFESRKVSIPDDEKIDVYLSQYESASKFWVQEDSYFIDIFDLQQNLQIIGASQAVLTNKSVGTKCLAQFTDKQWYRAKVIESDGVTAKVFFLDYGNTHEVDVESLRKLPVKFFRWPYFTVCCCLSDTSFLCNDELVEKCSYVMSETDAVFQLTKVGNGDPVPVSIFIGDKDLKTVIYETELPPKEEIQLPAGDTAIPEVSENQRGSSCVFVSHICSPAKFWIQNEDATPTLEGLADALVEAESFSPLENVEVGTLCAALFQDDEQWYRAKVLEQCDESYHVVFIDYGNSSFTMELRQLPEDLINKPPVARCCRLQFPSGVDSWSVDADKKFVEISGEGTVVFQMEVCSDDDPVEVRLLLEDKNVSDIIEVTHLKSSLNVTESNILISHINSPSDFWIQLENESTKLESIADQLAVADTFLTLEEVSNGVICAAQFPDDDLWYRARITSVEEENIKVTFIDYGNSSSVTEIHRLPDELASVPPLALHCSLPLPNRLKQWPEKAEEEFCNIFGDGSNIYVMSNIQEGDPSIVSLKLNNDKVEDLLLKCVEISGEKLSSVGELSSSSTEVEILTETEVMMDLRETMSEVISESHFFSTEERLEDSVLEDTTGANSGDSVNVEGELGTEIVSEKQKTLEQVTVEGDEKPVKDSTEMEKLIEDKLENNNAQTSLEEIKNVNSTPKHFIEHKEEIIRDLKVELQVPSEVLPVQTTQKDGSEDLLECAGVNVDETKANEVPEDTTTGEDVDEINTMSLNPGEEISNFGTLSSEDTQLHIPESCGQSTPLTVSPKKASDLEPQNEITSEDDSALNNLDSSSISSTLDSNEKLPCNESQESADISESLDDETTSTSTVTSLGKGCIEIKESVNYPMAVLHKTEELYESSKAEVKSSNSDNEVNSDI